MRKGGGKSKGAAFERECCRKLSLWVSDGKQEDCFWRSAMSGGRATVAAKNGKKLLAHAGDITCTGPHGALFSTIFLAECKFYKDLEYKAVFSRNGKLLQFWRILVEESKKYNKEPFLFAKQNRMPVFICLNNKGIRALATNPFITATVPYIAHFPFDDLYLIEMNNFFSLVLPPKIS